MENSTSLALQKKKTKKLIVLIVVGALSLTLIAAGILFVLVSKTIKIPPRSEHLR